MQLLSTLFRAGCQPFQTATGSRSGFSPITIVWSFPNILGFSQFTCHLKATVPLGGFYGMLLGGVARVSRVWFLKVPYEERYDAQRHGARWDSKSKFYTYTGLEVPPELAPYVSDLFSWERWQEDNINYGERARSVVGLGASGRVFTPRPHQTEASNLIFKAWEQKARGFLLADDVGLGKTISAWGGVQNITNAIISGREKTGKPQGVVKILVVCPLSVIPHWRNTIQMCGWEHMRVCVINYDQVKKLLTVPESAKKAKRARTKNKRIASEGDPVVDWDIIVMDESHKLKNPSQRTKSMSRIAQYGQKSTSRTAPPFLLWMSATAGQNPLELSYLSPLLAQATNYPHSALNDFGPWLNREGFHVSEEARWKKWTWTDDATLRAEDVQKMRTMLFTGEVPVALRRLPTDIAGWPEIVRQLVPVKLDTKGYGLYQTVWKLFRQEMHLALRGGTGDKGFAAMLRFRQKASLLRTQGTVDFVDDLLDNNMQVAVSSQFLESLDTVLGELVKRKIKVSVMDGRNVEGRENERLKFQTGETQVVLFTPVEGFSLHQSEQLADGTVGSGTPRALIIHDPRYSGIEMLQIEGRTHRDGKNANAYYMYSEGTVEESIVRTLVDRLTTTKALVGDDTTVLEELTHFLNTQVFKKTSTPHTANKQTGTVRKPTAHKEVGKSGNVKNTHTLKKPQPVKTNVSRTKTNAQQGHKNGDEKFEATNNVGEGGGLFKT